MDAFDLNRRSWDLTTAKEQGIAPDVFLRLLSADYSADDYRRYNKTQWFIELKQKALEHFGGGCLGCMQPATTIQHPPRSYKKLWREDFTRDVFPICQRCNRKLRRR